MLVQSHFAPQIRNSESQNCLDTMGHKSGEKVGSSYCHGLGGNQVFAYTKRQQIMSDDNCLDASNANGPVNLVRCHGMGGNQEWSYNENVKHIATLDLRRSYKNLTVLGSHYKACELRQLPDASHQGRPINAAPTAVHLLQGPTVADAVEVQVAVKARRRRRRT